MNYILKTLIIAFMASALLTVIQPLNIHSQLAIYATFAYFVGFFNGRKNENKS